MSALLKVTTLMVYLQRVDYQNRQKQYNLDDINVTLATAGLIIVLVTPLLPSRPFLQLYFLKATSCKIFATYCDHQVKAERHIQMIL